MSQAPESGRCPNCGEYNDPRNRRCWLCETSFEGEDALKPGDTALPVAPRDDARPFSSNLVALVIAGALTALGTILLYPGTGALLAIALILPFLRTVVVLKKRQRLGGDSTRSTIGLFLASTGVLATFLGVIALAGFGFFCVACFSYFTVAHSDDTLAVMLGGTVALAIFLPALYFYGKWVIKRWRRDVGKG